MHKLTQLITLENKLKIEKQNVFGASELHLILFIFNLLNENMTLNSL